MSLHEIADFIFDAAWSCGHEITHERVVLRHQDDRPGNALNQLRQRIREAVEKVLSPITPDEREELLRLRTQNKQLAESLQAGAAALELGAKCLRGNQRGKS